MMRSLITAVILAIIFTWFALANSQVVTVSIFVWSFQFSLSLVILISILIGVIFTGIVSAAEQARMLGKIKELENKLKNDEDLLKGEQK
jgi:uncharacterized integral membrane protein